MTGDLILYVVFLGLGIMVGLTWKSNHSTITPKEEELPKEIKKLQHELTVQRNVNASLLEDVKYWRDKAKNDNHTA